MSITNYSELNTAVANWLHRGDLTSSIPDFITLAEAKLNRRLRLRAQESTATGTVSASVALPSDFAEVISIKVATGQTSYAIPYRPRADITGQSAAPLRYTITGDNIVFDPASSSYTYTLTYYAKFSALSAGANWLITNAPDVYLYASLMESAPYTKNDPRIQTWASLLENAISDLKKQDFNSKLSGLEIRAV